MYKSGIAGPPLRFVIAEINAKVSMAADVLRSGSEKQQTRRNPVQRLFWGIMLYS